MAEWLNAVVLKTVEPKVPGVRSLVATKYITLNDKTDYLNFVVKLPPWEAEVLIDYRNVLWWIIFNIFSIFAIDHQPLGNNPAAGHGSQYAVCYIDTPGFARRAACPIALAWDGLDRTDFQRE